MILAIVDDDDDVRRALARLLRSMGHEVHVFASAEAFDVAALAPDCLILDVRMPGLSGPELRQRLRSRQAALPVVFITGDSDPPARDLGSLTDTPAVTKPFEDVTLMAAIERAIRAVHEVRGDHAL